MVVLDYTFRGADTRYEMAESTPIPPGACHREARLPHARLLSIYCLFCCACGRWRLQWAYRALSSICEKKAVIKFE